jgi:hypothetical protein
MVEYDGLETTRDEASFTHLPLTGKGKAEQKQKCSHPLLIRKLQTGGLEKIVRVYDKWIY